LGFVDDDPRKHGIKDEYGLKVLGTTSSDDLARVLDDMEPDEVVIAIPSAPGTLRARVVAACRERGIPVRTTPTVFELLRDGSGELSVTRQLRSVQVEDILGRTAIPVLADCKEQERMREVFGEHRPAVVFHAAAYKHVTMMELNPIEAIRNNAIATQQVARTAGQIGVATFVLVSTDKA